MRHMGNSGKLAVIAAIAAAGMLVLTAITLEEAVMISFLGLVALAYLSAVAEVFVRRRRVVLVATAAGTSLTVAFALAFISTWEFAFAGQRSVLGTPLPTGDPDNYFYWAAAGAVATLAVLFLGAAWPSGARSGPGSRRRIPRSTRGPASGGRRPATGRTAGRVTAGPGTAGKGTGGRPATPKSSPRRPAAQRSPSRQPAAPPPAPRPSAQDSGPRAPARLPAGADQRPSSVPARKPAPKPAPSSGAKAAPRR